MRSTSKKNRRTARQSATRKLGRRNYQLESLEERRLLAADLVDWGYNSGDGALFMTFSEEVQPGTGTGNITIKQHLVTEKDLGEDGILEINNDAFVWGANVSSDEITFSGDTVTIDPAIDLPEGVNLYVEVDPGAIRDLSSDVGEAVLLDEDFERLMMFDSGLSVDALGQLGLDDFIVTYTGTLVVNEAGEYTFASNSDDGAWLLIDLDQDAEGDLEELRGDFGDEVITDNSTHGNQFRLSTCEQLVPAQSCEGEGVNTYELAAGEYLFEYGFFDGGGGGSGELSYSKGTLEAFDAATFVLVGDDSQGIGVTEDGITATTYKSDGVDIQTLFEDAWGLRDGFIPLDPAFPEDNPGNTASAVVPFVDGFESGGFGAFDSQIPVPGLPVVPSEDTDWTDEAPYAWFRDNENLPLLPGDDGIEGTEDDVPPFAEYAGFTFLDKIWWIQQQGGGDGVGQNRVDFELGQNVVAVVDPDAYDDGALDIGDGPRPSSTFDAGLDTPMISLDGVAENSAVLKFDSSWWNEDSQTVEGSVEYFDESGESLGSTVLYRWESVAESEFFKDVNRNEEVVLDLDNPADAASMVISFDMPVAGNDWWWAIDNIVVTGDVAGATFAGIQDRETFAFTVDGGGDLIDGDVNGDGTVDLFDFNLLKENFGATDAVRDQGDLNEDTVVDLIDFNILKENFGDSAAAIAFASLADDGEDA